MRRLVLYNRNLIEIPNDLPNNLIHLYIASNQIIELKNLPVSFRTFSISEIKLPN